MFVISKHGTDTFRVNFQWTLFTWMIALVVEIIIFQAVIIFQSFKSKNTRILYSYKEIDTQPWLLLLLLFRESNLFMCSIQSVGFKSSIYHLSYFQTIFTFTFSSSFLSNRKFLTVLSLSLSFISLFKNWNFLLPFHCEVLIHVNLSPFWYMIPACNTTKLKKLVWKKWIQIHWL